MKCKKCFQLFFLIRLSTYLNVAADALCICAIINVFSSLVYTACLCQIQSKVHVTQLGMAVHT